MSTHEIGDGHPAESLATAWPESFISGSKAVYPGLGVCRVVRVVNRTVDSGLEMFYHLTVLDDVGGELFIPVLKARAIGVRSLTTKSEIPALLEHLKMKTSTAENRKQRVLDNMRLLATGSAFDLAEIVGSLTDRGNMGSLTARETLTLERARRLLECEMSEVMNEKQPAVAEQIDRALKARIEQPEPVPSDPGSPYKKPVEQ